MSEYFEKNVFVHERNDKEEILPVDIDVTIGKKDGKLQIIPMTKGQIDEMRNKSLANKELMKTNKEEAIKKGLEQDKALIMEHVVKPKFDEKDYTFFKPKQYVELVKAIMVASGFEKKEIDEMYSNLIKQAGKKLGDDSPKA